MTEKLFTLLITGQLDEPVVRVFPTEAARDAALVEELIAQYGPDGFSPADDDVINWEELTPDIAEATWDWIYQAGGKLQVWRGTTTLEQWDTARRERTHLMADITNGVQQLHLRLIEMASFNDFNGIQVSNDLRMHHDLWDAAIMDGEVYGSDEFYWIKLRDLPMGHWNVDTLFISAARGKEQALLALAETWHADSISWVEIAAQGYGGTGRRVLRVWWD